MRQLMGFGLVIAAITVSAWGFVHELNREKAPPDARAFSYASVRLESASERLAQMHGILGSYVGIDRDLFVGMTIAYTRDDSYCLQLMREGHVYHRGGPGGSTQRGPCV
jgi:hypothetical protein